MLDQDSVLEPKLTGKSVPVEGTVRHLSHEDLEAFANGRLAAARVKHCSDHLDSCEECRAELEDIRTLQTELSSFSRAETGRREPVRRARRRGLAVPLAASGAVVLVAAVGTVFWVKHQGARVPTAARPASVALAEARSDAAAARSDVAAARSSGLAGGSIERAPISAAASVGRSAASPASAVGRRPAPALASVERALVSPVASAPQSAIRPTTPVSRSAAPPATVARPSAPTAAPIERASALTATTIKRSPNPPTPPTAPATVAIQSHDTRLAEEIAALPEDLKLTVSDAIQHGRVQLPPDVRRIHVGAAALSVSLGTNTGFSLLGPFGEATSDTRPKFNWQPLPGAIGYTVAIVDQGLRPVQHSRGLRATSWRPRQPLARGRTYLWQVTATMHGGSKIVATSPSPSEALLRVIPRKLADEMTHFQRGHQDAHLVLGVLYAQAGMVTEGENELREVPQGNSSYALARRLLDSLSSSARSDTIASR